MHDNVLNAELVCDGPSSITTLPLPMSEEALGCIQGNVI